MIVGRLPLVQTNYLPAICGKARCLRDAQGGSKFCDHHQPKPKTTPAPWTGRKVVYFVAMEGTAAIKVGVSQNFTARFSSLKCGSPNPLMIFAVIEGSEFTEARIHRELESSHITGEWYKANAVAELFERIAGSEAEKKRFNAGEVLVYPNNSR